MKKLEPNISPLIRLVNAPRESKLQGEPGEIVRYSKAKPDQRLARLLKQINRHDPGDLPPAA